MIKFIVISLVTGFNFLVLSNVQSQGSKDAGASSIESLTPRASANELLNEFSAGINIGSAQHNIFAFGAHLGYLLRLGPRFSIDSRLTFAGKSNVDANESGFGDVFVIANYKQSSMLTFSGGVKIPTNSANRKFNAVDHLPMDFQTSLGTLDLILAIAWQKRNWLAGIAYQQPLLQNDNQFIGLHGRYHYKVTYGFERRADLLFRCSYLISVDEKFTIAPGLLPILHLGDDTAKNPGTHTEYNLLGSAGLTVNATGFFIFTFNDKSNIGFNIAFPLIERKNQPGGLTRSIMAGVEYGVTF